MAIAANHAVRKSVRAIAITIVAIPLLAFAAFAAYFLVKSNKIRRCDARFSVVEIGDSKSNVIAIMGAPHRQRREDLFRAVPETTNGFAGDQAMCKVQLVYDVDTFFLPISWVIGLDENEIVVTKFRLN